MIRRIFDNFQRLPYGVEYTFWELHDKLTEGLHIGDLDPVVGEFIASKRESGELVKVMQTSGDRYYRRGTA